MADFRALESESPIVLELGVERADALETSVNGLTAVASQYPDRTSWFAHVPIPLRSLGSLAASHELADKISLLDPRGNWFLTTAKRPDGTFVGYASDLFVQSGPPSPLDVVRFGLLNLHSRMSAWCLGHLWRALDLAAASQRLLTTWEVIPAAACARGLLEGVAAFMVEGARIQDEWSRFKSAGLPTLETATSFRVELNKLLGQAQFGSRLSGTSEIRERTNVLTFVRKMARWEPAVDEIYEWLCDAVHPSWGFTTVFVATQGVHEPRAIFAADLAHRTATAPTAAARIEPTIAWKTADAAALSVRRFLQDLPTLRWTIFDLGLTTGVAHLSRTPYFGTVRPVPGRNDPCPCGSGRRFKACRHEWGSPAEPPTSASGEGTLG
jgi:hypothetical protein